MQTPADSASGWRGGEIRIAQISPRLFGAGDMLTALGWPPTLLSFLRFSGLIAALMLGFLGLTVAIGELLPIPPALFQVLLWACWLFWLGYVLPRHQARDLAVGGNAYKRAFWRELGFGIGFNFAMILRPMAVGLVEGGGIVSSPWVLALGLLLTVLGVSSILGGSRQLGVSCAFFVYEYSPEVTPPVVDRGVYGLFRHPLFTGGICMSIGLAICVGTPVALQLAAVNLAALVPYLPVEDHRCSSAVGPRYRRYREEVAGIVPRSRRGLPPGEVAQRQNRPA
jgi:protein-S-isoprenylcysteine O-methyltransferase Ste14